MMMMAAGGYLGWSKLELDQLYQHLLTGRSMPAAGGDGAWSARTGSGPMNNADAW
jgi:hypothetical protein